MSLRERSKMVARVELAASAAAQIARLRDHYEGLGRIEAILNLARAEDEARRKIGLAPANGLPAPRPYPDLARPGFSWVKAGRYWFHYTVAEPVVIVAVFYETADIPSHI